MSFKSYLLSKTFLLNLIIAAIVTLVILFVVMRALRAYTNHGESFAIPDFSGMNIEQVDRLIKGKELSYVVADSLYTKEALPGAVIDQFPSAGFHVKKGRTVFLTICAKNPEQIVMPALTDISVRQAVSLMQRAGLNVGKIDYVPSEYPNLVLEQKFDGVAIASGKLIDKGSAIDLVVGKSGSGEKTVIPDLIGVTLEQAGNEIAAVALVQGSVIYDQSVITLGDSLRARVWQQRPEASSGQVVDQGISIDLWLTVDEEKIYMNGGIREELPEGQEETDEQEQDVI